MMYRAISANWSIPYIWRQNLKNNKIQVARASWLYYSWEEVVFYPNGPFYILFRYKTLERDNTTAKQLQDFGALYTLLYPAYIDNIAIDERVGIVYPQTLEIIRPVICLPTNLAGVQLWLKFP